MSNLSASNPKQNPLPKGYSVHEPRMGAVPQEEIKERFKKLEALIAKARKSASR